MTENVESLQVRYWTLICPGQAGPDKSCTKTYTFVNRTPIKEYVAFIAVKQIIIPYGLLLVSKSLNQFCSKCPRPQRS